GPRVGMEFYSLSIHEALSKLRAQEISAVELTRAYLARISETDPRINAYLTVTAERALKDAERADERRARGDESPLLGIPIALKDIFCTAGIETTCASRILKRCVPP